MKRKKLQKTIEDDGDKRSEQTDYIYILIPKAGQDEILAALKRLASFN